MVLGIWQKSKLYIKGCLFIILGHNGKAKQKQIKYNTQTSLPYFSFVFLQSAPNRGRAHIKTNKDKNKNKIWD